MMNGFDGIIGGMGWVGIFPVLFWIALLAVVVWAVARIFPSRGESAPRIGEGPDPAVEALRVRFARGEIDAEEYERALDVIRGRPSLPDRRTPAR